MRISLDGFPPCPVSHFIVAFVICSRNLLGLSPSVFGCVLLDFTTIFVTIPSSLHLRHYNSSSLYMVLGPSACMASIKRLSNCSLLSPLPLPLHQRLLVLHPRLPWTTTTISTYIKHQRQPSIQRMYVSDHLLLAVQD
jgi:hypothetical protein